MRFKSRLTCENKTKIPGRGHLLPWTTRTFCRSEHGELRIQLLHVLRLSCVQSCSLLSWQSRSEVLALLSNCRSEALCINFKPSHGYETPTQEALIFSRVNGYDINSPCHLAIWICGRYVCVCAYFALTVHVHTHSAHIVKHSHAHWHALCVSGAGLEGMTGIILLSQ